VVYGLGILGLGTVGTGVAQILEGSHHPLLRSVVIRRIGVRALDKPRDINLDPSLFTTDLKSIVTDPEVAVVMELIGGLEPARTLILAAIAHKKHVITANKAVIARHGTEIFAAAEAAGV
jgi:homoserine dehydrogenase